MRIGLAVTKVARNTGRNLHAMLEFIGEAARNEADLVLFGEAAPTGLINNDDPCHDTAIAEPVPGGPTMNTLAQAAISAEIYVGTGVLEKDGECLYDTAVLDGSILAEIPLGKPGLHVFDA